MRCVFIANTKQCMNFTLEKKNSKCRWKEVIYITRIYATLQPATQIQGFKNMFVEALQETSSKLNYL